MKRFAHIGLIYALGDIFEMESVNYIDSSTYTVLSQSKLIITATMVSGWWFCCVFLFYHYNYYINICIFTLYSYIILILMYLVFLFLKGMIPIGDRAYFVSLTQPPGLADGRKGAKPHPVVHPFHHLQWYAGVCHGGKGKGRQLDQNWL